MHAALLAVVPAAGARVHERVDLHAAAPHLHAPQDRSCPPPPPADCHFCRVASTALEPGTSAGPMLPLPVVEATIPPPPAAPFRVVRVTPVGSRAPPAA